MVGTPAYNRLLSIISLCITALVICGCFGKQETFRTVDGTRIIADGKSDYFIGTNLWYAGRLSTTEEGRVRLAAELESII